MDEDRIRIFEEDKKVMEVEGKVTNWINAVEERYVISET